MRSITSFGFLKIVEGCDYEFLIEGFAFNVQHNIKINNGSFHSFHTFQFKGCSFKSLIISNSEISSHWVFENCYIQSLVINSSVVKNIDFRNCRIQRLEYSRNKDAGDLTVSACRIKTLEYIDNLKFTNLNIGCQNLLDRVNILNNGSESDQESSFYLCPEKFNEIKIDHFSV